MPNTTNSTTVAGETAPLLPRNPLSPSHSSSSSSSPTSPTTTTTPHHPYVSYTTSPSPVSPTTATTSSPSPTHPRPNPRPNPQSHSRPHSNPQPHLQRKLSRKLSHQSTASFNTRRDPRPDSSSTNHLTRLVFLIAIALFSVFLLLHAPPASVHPSRQQESEEAESGRFGWDKSAGHGNGNNETESEEEWTWSPAGGIRGEHCLRYGTREYRAQLVKSPGVNESLDRSSPSRKRTRTGGTSRTMKGFKLSRVIPQWFLSHLEGSEMDLASEEIGGVGEAEELGDTEELEELEDTMMQACRHTPMEVEGRVAKPGFCMDLGFNRGVWGFWAVDYAAGRIGCEPTWGPFIDKGCVDHPANSRRIRSHLENLDKVSNWQIMCVTTPVIISPRTDADVDHPLWRSVLGGVADIDGPVNCVYENGDVYGEWLVKDPSCATVNT